MFFSDCVMSMLAFGTKENKGAHSFVTSSFLIQDKLFQRPSSFCLLGKQLIFVIPSSIGRRKAFKHLNVSVYIFKYLVVLLQ